MINEPLMEQIARLAPTERLELISVVWDSLSQRDLPLTAVERALLDARLADMELNPNDQSSWDDVKHRLEQLRP
jgi:putative addiction module component (TIGR02574 family)